MTPTEYCENEASNDAKLPAHFPASLETCLKKKLMYKVIVHIRYA